MIRTIKHYLEEEFGLEEPDTTSLVNDYVTNLSALRKQARQYLVQKDWKQLQRNAHSVKGTSFNVGAVNIADLGITLEEAARSENPGQCQKALEEINLLASLLHISA